MLEAGFEQATPCGSLGLRASVVFSIFAWIIHQSARGGAENILKDAIPENPENLQGWTPTPPAAPVPIKT